MSLWKSIPNCDTLRPCLSLRTNSQILYPMPALPPDHEARVQRALVSLQGLSVGDSFGERFFGPPGRAQELIAKRLPPPPKWSYTDDTAMALSVVDTLVEHGRIDQDYLAIAFAKRFNDEPDRGYGGGARQILDSIGAGVSWRIAAAEPFGGEGSQGNGAAMRVAPLGAYFADDIDSLVDQALASAQVTHLHPDGQAGAVAVALAAAFAWQSRDSTTPPSAADLLRFVESRMPPSETRQGVRTALSLPSTTTVDQAASALGAGYRITSADTVPFSLWCASRSLSDYEAALWATVSALGDRDTTCAIVGGIVVLSAGLHSIPERWILSRESLSLRYRPRPQGLPNP